jgi:hypothetical protein
LYNPANMAVKRKTARRELTLMQRGRI